MPKMSPSEFAAKWAKEFGASGDKYEKGIDRVQENPAQKAIAAQDRLLNNFTAAVLDGKWAAGLSKVSTASWKQACKEKGKAALAASARLAQDKVMRAESELGPIRDGIVSSLPQRGTIEENLERARQMALKMHEARKKG